ncbi:MAG: RNA 2',3'-cyclic phosphodiesterase [Rhodospirillaceae bacterium]|nr:MAG: RNA 2',3'-cyclic phosphodiesterase [Rhodospirillaceae bacterium]
MMRLFVALGMPEGLGHRLAILQAGQPGARWVAPESMHLTLRFIGEVPRTDAEDVDEMLAGIVAPAFDLHLQGVGQFGQGTKTRALWVGVAPSDSLDFLQAKVESAVVRAGQPPEGRKFTPHITLARFSHADSNRLQNFVEGNSLFRAGPWTVDHFTLFESRMGKGGSVYIPLADYELKPPR